jgi:hypothetical protein
LDLVWHCLISHYDVWVSWDNNLQKLQHFHNSAIYT